MPTPPTTPRRPLWQQLGIWVIALVVAAGLITSGNQALTESAGEPPPSPVDTPRPDIATPDSREPPAPSDNATAPETEKADDDSADDSSDDSSDDSESDSSADGGDDFSAADQLATLSVDNRASREGYSRGEFGRAWPDTNRSGCDTRNDILARDLDDIVRDSRCRVLSGVLLEPFSGNTIVFERGEQTSALVHIDHVVALSNAWQTGAQQLSERDRIRFANDPLNLIAVSGRLNQQKSDSDAASWLPPDRDFWCEYVARQVGVKAHYSLWVTPAERDQMARVLATCPTFPALTPAQHGNFRPGLIPAR